MKGFVLKLLFGHEKRLMALEQIAVNHNTVILGMLQREKEKLAGDLKAKMGGNSATLN